MAIAKRRKIQILLYGVVLALLGGPSHSWAQGDILVWQFQHSQPGIQEAQASTVDSQGNLIITGYTDITGDDDDFYTIKLGSDGQTVLWSARYDHPQSDDWAVAVAVDGEDNVIVTGFVFNGVNSDIATIKYDGADGTQLWAAILNGAANGNDMPRSLAIDAQNNIYVAGYSQNGVATADDGLLFKLSPAGPNQDGTPAWQVHYNGAANGEDRFNGITIGVDGMAVTGHTTVMHSGSRQDFDFLTIKFDYSGNTVWQKIYDHGSGDDLAYYAGMDQSGNVIVTGEVLTGLRHDMRTSKYAAADGQEQWATPYSGGSPNIPKGLVVGSDGEVYVIGSTFTVSGKDDYYTARYAGGDGVAVWERVFDSGLDNSDIPHALAIDRTGGLYVTGYTHKATTEDDDFQTLKYNKANGNQIWQQAEDGPPVGGNQQPVGVAVAMALTADGSVYVAGWSQQATEDLDYFAVKYNADLLNSPTGLTATVVSQTRIDLAWADNSSTPNEDNFCVERCQGFGCTDYTELTCAVPQNQTTYSDSSVIRDNWYSYRLKGKSAELGYSLPTAPVSVLSTVIDYPAPEWLYTHDGDGLDDMALAIAMGGDHNPVATGTCTTPENQYDYYTIKLDRSNAATPFWIADYDGVDSQVDIATSLVVDTNNDVVISGFSSLDSGQGSNTNDIFTIKYASTGPAQYTGYPLWTSQYSGPGNDDDRATTVASASDGSRYAVVTGYGRNAAGNDDIYLIKYKPNYDAVNQKLWAIAPFDGGYDDYPAATAFTPAGNVVVVGTTNNAAGDSDIFISQYSGAAGAVMSGWPYSRDFGHGDDGINALTVAADGSIYVAGYTKNAAGNLDIYVNKFNGAGLPQWGLGQIVDGDGHGFDEAKAIAIDPNDGEIVVGATVTSASGSLDFHVLRFTAAGTLRWTKTLDLIAHDELLTAMAMSPSGEICLVGETDDDVDTNVLAVKYDAIGNLTGSTIFDHGFDDFATAITGNRLGEFFISGYSATGPLAIDDYDFVVFRFNGQALQAPSPFAAVAHYTSVDLSWTENDPDISGYKLYRTNGACTVGGTGFSESDLILTVGKETKNLTNSGLNSAATYCYGVRAYRSVTGEESWVIARQVTTITPVAPDNLVATPKNTSAADVCWHDNTTSEDGFEVQRCAGIDCDFSEFTTLLAPPELNGAATSTCMVDTTACDAGAGKTFRYRVLAYKSNDWKSGVSAASPSDTVTVPELQAPSGLATTLVLETKVDLQWTDNTVDESDFVVERCLGADCTDFVEVGAIGATVFTDSGVTANTTYTYRVKARKQTSCGPTFSPPSPPITVPVIPPAPQPLSATFIRPGVASLTWTPKTTTHTSFAVERCNGVGCTDFFLLASPTSSKYVDTTACFGIDGINRYRVTAIGPWGESAPSAVAEAVSGAGTTPANLSTLSTESSVNLSWTHADANWDGFTIERCAGSLETCNQSAANFTVVSGSPSSGQETALQALWHMDESSWSGVADEVVDSSGKGNHGTAMLGAAVDSPGKAGFGAALFNGTTNYISTNLPVDQSTTTAGATFTAWVYPTVFKYSYQYIFSTDNGGVDWGLSYYGGYWYLDNGSTSYNTWIYVTLNTWQHVAVVFNPGTGVQLFVNGVLRSTSTVIDFDGSANPVNIGRHPTTTGTYFTGRMDEVAVLNRPLSSDEVSKYYANSRIINFTDSDGITLATTYNYRIKPFFNTTCTDWGGNISYAAVSATTPTVPIAPDTLAVTEKGTTQLDLAWSDKTGSESAFIIERCQGTNCDFSTKETFQVGAGVTTYQDSSVCQGTTYRYRVKAVKGAAAPWEWESAYSAAVEKSALAANPVALTLNAVSQSEITAAWNDVNLDEDSYELSRCRFEAGVTACDQEAQFTVLDTLPGTVAGTLLQYRMDETLWNGTAGEVRDVGNVYNGYAYATTTTADGKFGRAGSFGSGYVSTYLTLNQAITSPGVTMEAWVKPTSTDANARSVFSTDNGGYDWGVVAMNGKWYVNTGASQYDTGLTVDLGVWQHVTAVFTPQVGIKFYKNSEVVSINEIGYDASTYPMLIGHQANCYYLTTTCNFLGLMDEVLIYGRPLTAAEVAIHNTYQETSTYSYRDLSVQQGTTYFYKVAAKKAASCSWSKEAIASKTTPASPPPTNLVVVNFDNATCTLGWTDNNSSETGYKVSRCDGASGGCASPVVVDRPAGTGSMTYQDTTLGQGQTYTFRVWAVGAWGATTYVEKTMTTAAQPVPPTNPVVSNITTSGCTLGWTDNSYSETGYVVSRCDGASGDCGAPVTFNRPAGTGSMTFADSGLGHGQTYTYRVWATGAWVPNLTTYIETTMTTLSQPPPTNLVVVNFDNASCTLSWTDNNSTETGYVVSRCDGASGDCGSPVLVNRAAGTGSMTYQDTTLSAAQTYTYRVWATGTWVPNKTTYIEKTMTTAALPSPPTLPVVSSITTSGCTLGWTDNSYTETGYVVSRCVGASGDCGSPVTFNRPAGAATGSMTFPDSGLDHGQTYTYRIWATGAWGQTTYIETTMTTLSQPPPTNLVVVNFDNASCTLSWTDNNSTETGYVVSRCDGASGDCGSPVLVNRPAGTGSMTYQDTTLSAAQTYTYRVWATGVWVPNKTAHVEKTMTTAALPPPPTTPLVSSITTTSCTLGWTDNSYTETGYVVSRCDGTSHDCGSPVVVNRPAGTGTGSMTYTDTSLSQAQTYTYRIWAIGAWGQSTSVDKTMTTAAQPSTPTGLTATKISEVEIDLAWNFTSSDETGVKLERCVGASCVEIALPANTKSYADNELMASTNYCYRVSVYKTATNGWQTAWTGQICRTTSLDVGALAATPQNTTTVGLAWSDPFQTETTSVVERCAGSLTTCCGGTPAACTGTFANVGEVATNQIAYTDSSVCAATPYTYRVTTMDEGLSRDNGGCWTKRVPFAFTSFPANTGIEVAVAYKTGMRADFGDIRFYDTTAHRELTYQIKSKTNSVSATVWLKTGAHNTIYLYYGNASATDSSGTVSAGQTGVASITYTATEGNGSTCLTFTYTWVAAPTLAVGATTPAASAPIVAPITIQAQSIVLTWSAGTNDESEFRVERDSGSGYTQIAVVPGSIKTYTDTSMPASAMCSYRVIGYKSAVCAWTSPPSNVVQIQAPPATPVLTVSAENAFQIRLDWTGASDSSFDIEAKVDNLGWMPVAGLGANQLGYTDMQSINPSTRYTYRVRAHRGTVYSLWSDEGSATTPPYTPGAGTCPLP